MVVPRQWRRSWGPNDVVFQGPGMGSLTDQFQGKGSHRWGRWRQAIGDPGPLDAEHRGFEWRRLGGEQATLVVDGDRTIHPYLDLDLCPGVARSLPIGEQLDSMGAELHCVVRGDGAFVLEAEQLLAADICRE